VLWTVEQGSMQRLLLMMMMMMLLLMLMLLLLLLLVSRQLEIQVAQYGE
jgi:Tfp pilus assembly protein PilN